MIRYIPFLKAKQNELKAMSELEADVRDAICPFFDFPRRNDEYESGDFPDDAVRIAQSLARNLGTDREFYFDNRDLDETIKAGTKHNYAFMLEQLTGTPVIPVVGIDRTDSHMAAVARVKQQNVIVENTIACRFSPEDFDDFGVVKGEIAQKLAPTIALFKQLDLILDCRMCAGMAASTTAQTLLKFSQKFCAAYPVRRVVITGSSIPASAADLANPRTERVVPRNEFKIFRTVRPSHGHAPLIFGDYGTVSPDYSDVTLPGEILQNLMVAKLTYTFDDAHYVIRGSKTKGNLRQYFTMASILCGKDFFRGAGYSSGEDFLEEKSRGRGKNCMPGTVIKPSVVSHISYMVRDAKI
jgi:hypothetical protein